MADSLQRSFATPAGAASMLRRLLMAGGVGIAVLLMPVIGMGGWALGLQLVGNIHVVEPSRLYRAAQLNGPALEEVLNRYEIQTVINLRGEHPGESWYDDELATTQRRNLVHIDIRMQATREPDDATVAKLISALRDAPEPILVHCKSGSDRTGLASALFELLVAHRSRTQSASQLSFRYGHFPWTYWSRTAAMDDTFNRLAASAR